MIDSSQNIGSTWAGIVSWFVFLHSLTLRQGFKSKWFIWELIPGRFYWEWGREAAHALMITTAGKADRESLDMAHDTSCLISFPVIEPCSDGREILCSCVFRAREEKDIVNQK